MIEVYADGGKARHPDVTKTRTIVTSTIDDATIRGNRSACYVMEETEMRTEHSPHGARALSSMHLCAFPEHAAADVAAAAEKGRPARDELLSPRISDCPRTFDSPFDRSSTWENLLSVVGQTSTSRRKVTRANVTRRMRTQPDEAFAYRERGRSRGVHT